MTKNNNKKIIYPRKTYGILKQFIGIILLLFILLMPFFFIQISLDYNILYRRIGNQNLSEIFTTIPTYKKIVIKLFTQFQSFWIGSLIYIYYQIKNSIRKTVFIFKIILILNFFLIFLYDLINSRLDLIIFIITIIILNNYFASKKFRIFTKRNLIILTVSLYSIFIIISLRKTLFAGNEVTFKQFSPFEVFASADHEDIENDFIIRLDGIEILNKVIDKYNYGFMTDLDLLKNNILISFFPNSSFGSNKRYNSETTIKVEMLNKYANIQELDYNASMLTDLFGTLGLYGFVLGAIALSYIISQIDFLLSNYLSYDSYKIFFILFIYSIIISFEMPFWGLVFTPIRFFPVFLLFLFIFNQILAYYNNNTVFKFKSNKNNIN
jgi:hypothetical protein